MNGVAMAATAHPVVFEMNGNIFANSRDVASFFDKRHDHVMRDIERLIEQEPALAKGQFPNFGEMVMDVEIGSGATRQSKAYLMNRDGFTLLAMGFTGAKALKWKLRYIEAFNRMEAELRRRPPAPAIDYSDPQVMLGVISHLQGEVVQKDQLILKQSAQIEATKPKEKFFDEFVNSEGLYGLQNAARALNMRPNLFVRWLKSKYLFYQGSDLVPYVQYRRTEVFDIKTKMVNDRMCMQTFITAKGLAYLNERVPDHIRLKPLSDY